VDDEPWTAERVLAALTPGMRMRDLFDTAKAATWIPVPIWRPSSGTRPTRRGLAACCILDFRRADAARRLGLRELYLRHHDRIDDWGMVDRAAPRVVGATLTGGPYDLLHELAASPDPLRRRTAMTAPLWFVKQGTDLDVEAGLEVAETLHADPDPLVHKPVGIYLAYAGERLPGQFAAFLDAYGARMPPAALRIAMRKQKATTGSA
jgi:3-methyladenine DNA glycosylase AlkD